MRKHVLMYLVFALCLVRPVWAGIDLSPTKVPLVEAVDYFQDRDHSVTIDALIENPSSVAWQHNEQTHINFGYTKSHYWLRVVLENPTGSIIERLLVISYPLLDNAKTFLVKDGKIITSYHVGDNLPYEQRMIPNRLFLLPLQFEPNSEYTLYVHAATTSSMQLPLTLWDIHAFHDDNTVKLLGFGFFFGALIIIAAYNFFLWFSVRDVSYLYYVSFVLSFSCLVATLEGLGFQYVWKNQIWWNDRSVVFLGCSTLFFATCFARHFLLLPQMNPNLNRVSLYYMAVVVLLAIITSFVPYRTSILILLTLGMLWSVFAIVFGVLNYRSGNQSARYFIFAWAFLIVCNVIYGLGQLAIVPRTFLVGISLQLGEIVEVLILSFALADRINILRQEKTQALRYAGEVDKKSAEVLKEANQQLQQALAIAEENHRKKDRFIMTVSHELRTPLNAISASVGQLSDAADEAEKVSLQKFIKFGADRLSTQVENLIMLAETEQSDIKPHVRTFYVESLLRHATRLADAYLFNKAVKFSVETRGEPYIAYRGDDYLLARLLMPVLENACKYTDTGSVILRANLCKDAIEFRVSDTGPGIAPDFQTRIYESFTQQSEGYQRSHEGLGIGLTACQRISCILDARIQLESEAGKGSCFTLHVPLQAEPDVNPLHECELKGCALIVEDNLVNAKVLIALIKKLGMTAELAENGLIALDKIKEQTFDVVLMDLQMPVMDGFSSALSMRKERVHCPIIAVTANSDYEARLRCLDVGMNDLIAKPLNKELLKEKLSFWMYAE